jgi:hypothetical protein
MTVDERILALHVNIESLHASVSELYAAVQRHDDRLEKLIVASQKDGENIRALARVAEIHERRLTALEGSADER